MATDQDEKSIINAPPPDKSFVLARYEDGERIELGHGCFISLVRLKTEGDLEGRIYRVRKRKRRRQ